MSAQPRIFISYKRNVTPDEFVAKTLHEKLESQNFNIFIDRDIPMGTDWAACIEEELRQSDYLLVLLSEHSVGSEMVRGEITTAHRLYQESNKRPKILPVRLKYNDSFKYPLSAILDPLNWASWNANEDTDGLIEQVVKAVSLNGGELPIRDEEGKMGLISADKALLPEPLPDAQPVMGTTIPLGAAPTEPLDPESKLYIERPSDLIAEKVIKGETVTLTIKGPEQIGKSSLLFKTLSTAQNLGKKVAFIDFQLFDTATLDDRNLFYRVFCSRIGYEIEVEDKTGEYWSKSGSQDNTMCSTRYMAEHLLPSIGEKTLVLAIDQLEDINRLTYKNEFFKMLRVWHERRANWKYSALWKRLNMVFVTSTEPYDLMDDQTSSPFNVGEVIEPPDFSSKDIETLNKLYNYPFNGDQVNQLSKLLCGHPYLVRKALWLVATERMTAADLFDHAADELGPFGDHLRHHLFNLRNKDGFLTELRQIINNKKSSNEEVFYDLRGAGLLRGEFKSGEFRCPLYEEYFRRHL